MVVHQIKILHSDCKSNFFGNDKLIIYGLSPTITAKGSSGEISSVQTKLTSPTFASNLVSNMISKDSSLSGLSADAPIDVQKKSNSSQFPNDSPLFFYQTVHRTENMLLS